MKCSSRRVLYGKAKLKDRMITHSCRNAMVIMDSIRHALVFGNQKINLHQSGKEFEPKAGKVQPGSEDLCFITEHPIDDVLKIWQSVGIEVCF